MKKMNIFIKTYGCSFNVADSERLVSFLLKEGHKITSDETRSDIVIINTCTVKGPSINNFLKYARKIDKPKIVAGCIPQTDPKMIEEELGDISYIGTHNLEDIALAVKTISEEGSSRKFRKIVDEKERKDKSAFETDKQNKLIEIIPINSGCLGSCSYCKTKKARGDLFSYNERNILNRIEKTEAHEIWLTSQDTGAYGKDNGSRLTELLKNISNSEKDFLLRVGMCNPNFALEMIDELLDIFEDERFFRFLHIPLQSGSDKILNAMNRKYSSDDFLKIADKIRKKFDRFTLATDIIVGFPGETEEDFEKTLDIVRKTTPEIINISKFWPMKGTPATNLKGNVDGLEIKKRSIKLKKLFETLALEKNKKWIGWEGKVFIDEKGTNNTFISRNSTYKQVILTSGSLGETKKVAITDATPYYLIGKS